MTKKLNIKINQIHNGERCFIIYSVLASNVRVRSNINMIELWNMIFEINANLSFEDLFYTLR